MKRKKRIKDIIQSQKRYLIFPTGMRISNTGRMSLIMTEILNTVFLFDTIFKDRIKYESNIIFKQNLLLYFLD